MKRQIIALGGGRFSMEPENPLLDQDIMCKPQETPHLPLFLGDQK